MTAVSTVYLVIAISSRGVGRDMHQCATPEDARQASADAVAIGRHAITIPVTGDALLGLLQEVAAAA